MYQRLHLRPGSKAVVRLQARHCYTRYNEYHRCVAQKGEGAEECRVFQRAYRSLCPGEWLERWNEQREEGTWPGRY